MRCGFSWDDARRLFIEVDNELFLKGLMGVFLLSLDIEGGWKIRGSFGLCG